MKIKGLAALVLCATGCVGQSTKLYINLDNSKHYSIKKSKEEGERDLVELAKTSAYEEAWFFNEENLIWTECGIKEEINYVLSRRPDNFEKLIHYHIHPRSASNITFSLFKNLIIRKGELEARLKKETKKEEKADLKASLIKTKSGILYHQAKILSNAFPSLNDMEISKNFKCVVVSEYGMMEYSNYKGFNPLMQKAYEAFIPEKLFMEIENCSNDQAAIWFTTKWLNEELFKGAIKLEFRPKTNPNPIPDINFSCQNTSNR